MNFQNFLSGPKGHFSGHETFPLRQLWLTKAFKRAAANSWESETFTEADAIVTFGVGKNMVSSIKHWAITCDVIRETDGQLGPGEIGEFLDQRDPYLENPSSSWLIHWILCGREGRSTTWAWLFSFVNHPTFDKELLLKELFEFASLRGFKARSTTLKRDLETCLKTYLPRATSESREESAEPLLSDLGLIRQNASGKSFAFNRGNKPLLSNEVFVFALCEFLERKKLHTGNQTLSLPFADIAHDFGSPGRVFKLDENSVAERLLCLEDLTKGTLRWSDTAGVRNVTAHTQEPLNRLKFVFLNDAYRGKAI